MLQNYTVSGEGMTRTFVPKDYPHITMLVNLSNGFVTITVKGKALYDSIKDNKPIDEEITRVLNKVLEKIK